MSGFRCQFRKGSLMKVHYPKLYNMAHLLVLNVLLLPKDLTIIFIHVFYACINCPILHFFGNLHNNIHVIHLCIMSVQSNFGHNPFSAKSLAVLATCIRNNIHVINLCIMSIQSNFGHNPFSAKSLAVS